MIAGILRPTAGTVHIAGVDLAADPIGAKSEARLHPRPAVHLREADRAPSSCASSPGCTTRRAPKVEHRARELLALFDLEEWRDELVESYSHGMRQKLIISSAFVHRPEVIVVDEPMVGLDPKAATHPQGSVPRVHAPRQHDHDVARTRSRWRETMCDRIGDHRRAARSARAARWTSCARARESGTRRARADLPAAHGRERGARAGRGAAMPERWIGAARRRRASGDVPIRRCCTCSRPSG